MTAVGVDDCLDGWTVQPGIQPHNMASETARCFDWTSYGQRNQESEIVEALSRLLIDRIVEGLSRTPWQTWWRPGVNNAPKLSKFSQPFVHGDTESPPLALAKQLQ